MGFGTFGFSEMLVVAVIVLIFFGPRRLPEIGQSLGRAMREFRRSLNEIKRELEDVNPRSIVSRELDLDSLRNPEPRVEPPAREPPPASPPPEEEPPAETDSPADSAGRHPAADDPRRAQSDLFATGPDETH